MPYPPAHPSLLRALAERGYAEPTPVQTAVLAPEGAGRDLLVSSQTGSGKTVAYGLALASTLLGEEPRFGPAREPLALIVAPTRELALQVHQELTWLFAAAGGRIVSCVGGMDPRAEKRSLAQGAHIVVGTPGRLTDHLERSQLDVSKLLAVVLDEADEMLDLGFREELELILDTTPATRRTLLFSATIPSEIASMARRYQKDALRIATTPVDEPHGDIEYRAMLIAPHERERAVVNVLRYFDVPGALVFCHTREAVAHLHGNLLERGFGVVALSGELSQVERTRALQAIRDGRARVCVATDVAARGLDLPDLGLVVHADLPRNEELLLHRSGRTGRAGKKGVCVLLVPYTARRRAERLLNGANVKGTWATAPTAQKIRARDEEKIVEKLAELAASPSEDDLAAGRELLKLRTPEELAAALVRLQRGQLPAPEELTTVRPDSPAPAARRTPYRRGDTVWFRMSVGREGNADPRWVLPFLCRRGHVTKAEIGKIDIRQRETRFEIERHAAARFAAASQRPDPQDGEILIEPIGDAQRGPNPGTRS